MEATVEIEDFYPYSYQPRRRYGPGGLPHAHIMAILEKGLPRYRSRLKQFVPFIPEFLRIPLRSAAVGPQWDNGFLPGLDAIALYGMIATEHPATFCEIGSGYSTRFAHLARSVHSPSTRIVSVDPEPRAEISTLCNQTIAKPLQDCELTVFQELDAGDILFLDGSHRVLQNTDVTVFFLEVLPQLKSGVYVQIHDIFWPWDYPIEWAKRMYSEQYMLGMLLVFAAEKMEIVLPNAFVSSRLELGTIFQPVWDAPHLKGIERHGGSFWFTLR